MDIQDAQDEYKGIWGLGFILCILYIHVQKCIEQTRINVMHLMKTGLVYCGVGRVGTVTLQMSM
jgi:hypothetical protein